MIFYSPKTTSSKICFKKIVANENNYALAA
jgi:hypothetical protein